MSTCWITCTIAYGLGNLTVFRDADPEIEATMIRCVKDLSPELEYRDLPLKRSRYRFLDLSLEIRSNSRSLSSLADGIYGAFRSSETGPETIVTYLLEEMEDFETPYRTIDPGFDSFLCSDPGRAVSFWGAQMMCNHLFRLPFLFIHGAVLESAGRAFIFIGQSGGGRPLLFSLWGGRVSRFILTNSLLSPSPEEKFIHSPAPCSWGKSILIGQPSPKNCLSSLTIRRRNRENSSRPGVLSSPRERSFPPLVAALSNRRPFVFWMASPIVLPQLARYLPARLWSGCCR